MATIKKIGGKFYIIKRAKTKHPLAWWRGNVDCNGLAIKVGIVYVPKELEGKKLRLNVEVIEDITKEKEFLRGLK